jgi:hypothetical protein
MGCRCEVNRRTNLALFYGLTPMGRAYLAHFGLSANGRPCSNRLPRSPSGVVKVADALRALARIALYLQHVCAKIAVSGSSPY